MYRPGSGILPASSPMTPPSLWPRSCPSSAAAPNTTFQQIAMRSSFRRSIIEDECSGSKPMNRRQHHVQARSLKVWSPYSPRGPVRKKLVIERRAIEQIVWHQHEASPHHVRLTMPDVVHFFAILTTGVVMDGALIPNDDVLIRDVLALGHAHIVGKGIGVDLGVPIFCDPEVEFRERFQMSGQSSGWKRHQAIVGLVAMRIRETRVRHVHRGEGVRVPFEPTLSRNQRFGVSRRIIGFG